ncbi:hypothetical protein N9D61_05125, partial [Planktomarina sp.]|nr:hypothetical protein [Planktomarina sp.]
IIQSNVENFQNSVQNTASTLKSNLVNSALDSIGPAGGLLKALLNGPSSMPALKSQTSARVASESNDWRVKLSLPSTFASQDVLKPLVETAGLVFPYTPTILVQHTANYDALQPIHSNYPFPQYQNSQIEDIVITGDFFCENAKDAQYWTAMVHYLRSITKMNYGTDDNSGAPPPVVKLTGYGDFVFPKVPVAIRNFTVDLPADVDYIKTQVEGDLGINVTTSDPAGLVGWAPVQSQVSVTVTPVFSRAKVSQFSLNSFVKGDYLGSGGNGGGFI